MKIAEIDKPPGLWCAQCRPGAGCAIYPDRPGECRAFTCGYLTNPDLGEDWRPDRARLIVSLEGEGRMVAIHVDATKPDAWRRPPFRDKIASWARLAEKGDRLVLVRIGRRVVVVFPDGESDLGLMEEGDRIGARRRATPGGPRREAFRIPRG
ncbi:hypothetical protein [Rhodoblastus sp.]|uniref:hypothetical protein n=1 Tax=Rhodoblastus sp. TaxID=1962975 RepID=UPI0035B32E5F